jgi:hypothetical protein
MKRLTQSLLAVIVCACSHVYVQSRTPQITKIKLQDYGWQPVPYRPARFGHPPLTPNLWLDHDDRVLVGFALRESDALATREQPQRSFHILRFTTEGKSDLALSLPTDSWYTNGFYLSPDDQILARANGKLQLLSKGESQVQSGASQVLAACPENCSIRQSFSRRTLIIAVRPVVGSRDAPIVYTILDASSSPPRILRTCSQMASMQITDKFVYRGAYDRDDDLTVRFPFCDVEHYEDFPKWGKGAPYVLNDETIFKMGGTQGGRFGIELIGAEGHSKFSIEMPKHDFIDREKIATDERYDRFAFIVNTEHGAHPRLDIGGHLVARRVVVLDGTGKELASIPTETNYYMDSNFALSPDGRRLAILDEGVVTVVELE